MWCPSARRRSSAAAAPQGCSVGEVADSFYHMNTRNLLPAGGLGLRLQASTTYKVNVRIDYAVGKDSDGLYFSIGEAF